MSMTESEIKKMIVESIREGLKAQRQAMEKTLPERPTEPYHEHIAHCPDCYKGFMENVGKLKETSEMECQDCGMPLGSEKMASNLKSCPMCGSENARKIER